MSSFSEVNQDTGPNRVYSPPAGPALVRSSILKKVLKAPSRDCYAAMPGPTLKRKTWVQKASPGDYTSLRFLRDAFQLLSGPPYGITAITH